VRLGVEAALVDGVLVSGDVQVEGGLVSAVGVPGAGRGVAVPGPVDLQVNGVGEVDSPRRVLLGGVERFA
jgi:N-acetylglucosamine-6-phosphate deacetylase